MRVVGSRLVNIRLVLALIRRVQLSPGAKLEHHLLALKCSRATLYRQIVVAREELGVHIDFDPAGGSSVTEWGVIDPAELISRR